eukprot:3938575-Pyramimonas_sp.AAC.2
MGYHLHSGGRWSGDYPAIDAATYAQNPDGEHCHVHRVKDITIPDEGPVCPVREGLLRHHSPEKRELISFQTSRPLGVPAQGDPPLLHPAEWDDPCLS